MEPTCKKCGSAQTAKNKGCGCNFRASSSCSNERTAAKKTMCIFLYATAKSPFRMQRRVFGRSHSLACLCVREFGERLPDTGVPGGIKDMDFDEIAAQVPLAHEAASSGLMALRCQGGVPWGQKAGFGPSRPLAVAHGEPWLGHSAAVILRHSGGYAARWSAWKATLFTQTAGGLLRNICRAGAAIRKACAVAIECAWLA